MTEAIQKSLRESPVARWTAMFVVSMSMFGGYYFNYAASSIKPILETSLGWTSGDIGLYTGSYAWFNVFILMLIFSGIILDRLGIRVTGIGATVVMVLGTTLNYWAMTKVPSSAYVTLPLLGHIKSQVILSCLGFAIFGVGNEAAGITLSKAIVKWFKGKEMALAMGLQMSIARLGTALAIGVSLPLAIKFNYSSPLLLAFILMLIGFIAFVTYAIMDIRLDKSEKDIVVDEEEPFRLKDIISIINNKAFWYIAILCVLFYGAVFPFMFYAPDFMINKYHVAPEYAGLIPMLLPIGTIVLTPLFGNIYDRKGKGATIMIIGSVMLLGVHILLAVPFLNQWFIAAVLVVILGIAFSLVPSAMWPSVPKFIPEKRLGSAYALIFYTQNIGLWAIPTVLGITLAATNPVVAPNKAMVKSSIEQSFNKAIAANNLTVNKGVLSRAIDKTTEKVVDSIVQTTTYEATPQNEINLSKVKDDIINSNLALAGGESLSSNPDQAMKQLSSSFKVGTFKIVRSEKLNIRYNYEVDILIFVVLGILSVIFGFLLKAEDKKKGYGLELPNIEEKAEAIEAQIEAE